MALEMNQNFALKDVVQWEGKKSGIDWLCVGSREKASAGVFLFGKLMQEVYMNALSRYDEC